jgi:type II secretory pathway predicted ATPase ExeA
MSEGHAEALATLVYAVQERKGFITLTGEVGTGKTTILNALLQKLESSVQTAFIFNTALEVEDLFATILEELELEPIVPFRKSAALSRLNRYLIERLERGQQTLLIVDEAQNLSNRAIEELRMLSNFQLGDQALLQSFLIGQPELRTMMQSPQMQQLRQRVIASYHLGPLDAAETRAYIDHRLAHVGWSGNPSFTDGCYATIHALTGGIPRRINTLCNRLMLAGFLGEKAVLDTADAQAIADEIRGELGMDAPADVMPAAAAVPDATASPTSALAVRRLEQRMERVERTVGATVDLLHGLLHPDKAGRAGER